MYLQEESLMRTGGAHVVDPVGAVLAVHQNLQPVAWLPGKVVVPGVDTVVTRARAESPVPQHIPLLLVIILDMLLPPEPVVTAQKWIIRLESHVVKGGAGGLETITSTPLIVSLAVLVTI